MPTGFTAMILDNPDTTFRDFALRCARGMGVLIHMRDEALDALIPETIEPYPYHRGELAKAYERSRELETMTASEAKRRADAEYREAMAAKAESDAKYAEENRVLKDMLAKAMAWQPPTPEHQGVKDFMIQQITISLPTPYDWKPERKTAAAWLVAARTKASEDIAYHAKHWADDQARAAKATAWLAEFRRALPKGSAEQ